MTVAVKGAPAQPAPVLFAATTGHVIAARDLLCADIAPGTVLDVAVVPDPLLKFSITDIGAPDTAMSSRAAPHADSSLALVAVRFSLEAASSLSNATAVGLRTPLEPGVEIDIDVLFELEVLLVDIFRAESMDVFSGVSLFAVRSHAGDLQHLSVLDLSLQVAHLAVFAECMLALQTEHVRLGVLLEADVASLLWSTVFNNQSTLLLHLLARRII